MTITPIFDPTGRSARREMSPDDELTVRLAGRYPGIPAEAVRTCVTAEFARFAHARLQSFVPILVERAVRGRLSRMASAPASA